MGIELSNKNVSLGLYSVYFKECNETNFATTKDKKSKPKARNYYAWKNPFGPSGLETRRVGR